MNRVAILVGALAVAGALVGCGQEPAAGGPAPTSSTAAPSTAHGAGHSSSTAEPSTTPAPTGPTTRTISVTVLGGQVTGETGRIEVALGTSVTVTVASDVADEIHVHGYDLATEVPAGGTASVNFTANTPGVFEVELEEAHRQLLELQVS